MNIYFVIFAFTFKSTSILVPNRACLSLYGMYVFTQEITVINIDHRPEADMSHSVLIHPCFLVYGIF
jgi:hypothetical protein